jgi:hypothetical protein
MAHCISVCPSVQGKRETPRGRSFYRIPMGWSLCGATPSVAKDRRGKRRNRMLTFVIPGTRQDVLIQTSGQRASSLAAGKPKTYPIVRSRHTTRRRGNNIDSEDLEQACGFPSNLRIPQEQAFSALTYVTADDRQGRERTCPYPYIRSFRHQYLNSSTRSQTGTTDKHPHSLPINRPHPIPLPSLPHKLFFIRPHLPRPCPDDLLIQRVVQV